MGRKHLTGLRATVVDGRVELTVYKGTPAFETDLDLFDKFRVYRKHEPDFEFGQDYSEYFDGLNWRQADLIYEGPLEASNNRKFTFIDWDARPGETFAYWMAPAEGVPSGPVPVRVRDPQVWWSLDRLTAEMDLLCRRFPDFVHIGTVGNTARGLPIRAIRAGLGERCIALIGAVHAGESGPELIVPVLDRLMANCPHLLRHASVVAIPALNLDERLRQVAGVPWYLRCNASGVDLNRNFPADWQNVERGYGLDSTDPASATYRGTCEASEPETRAVMDFLTAHCPTAVFAFHALAGICGHRFLTTRTGQSDEPYIAACRQFAQAYGSAMAPEFCIETDLSYSCTAGSLATWCYRHLKVPAFDLEISRQETAFPLCSKDQTDWPLLVEYQQRHERGLRSVLEMIAR